MAKRPPHPIRETESLMKMSARRIGILSILTLALALAGLSGVSAQAPATVDYDDDNDGLIDVTTLARLNAMRYDLDGNGAASQTDAASYAAAFPNPAAGMGCPSTGCVGYELRNDLTFDLNGDDDVDAADPYPNWTPIGDASSAFRATFEGNGHAIYRLTVSGVGRDVGLFGRLRGSTVRNLGLLEVDVSSTSTHANSTAGALAGAVEERVSNVYATGKVSGSALNMGGLSGLSTTGAALITSSWTNVAISSTGAGARVGGLVGTANDVDIFASCALGGVSAAGANAKAGGLVGQAVGASVSIKAACARGDVSATGARAIAGGFLGRNASTALSAAASYSTGKPTGATAGAFIGSGGGTISDSYWDSTTSAVADDADANSPEGKTTAELQTPTAASGIFANWDDLDLTDDSTANAVDDPWDFGTSSQYPAISFGSITASVQRDMDYDGDDDGFIDITKLAQLNAIRYDLDGNGVVSQTDSANYSAAFPNAASGMGCPSVGCSGYELKNDLTFDTDGDGDVDASDSYPNWTPIGESDTAAFAAIFKGNGRSISKLKINSAAARVGLFGSVSGTVKGVRLLDVDLTSTGSTASAGALAGKNAGTVSASSAVGTASSTGTGAANVGGLVGHSSGKIFASWARASVSAAGMGGNVGGLIGKAESVVTAVYARGPASSSGADANVGGLIGATAARSNVSASYSTGAPTASATDEDGAPNANVGGLIGSANGTVTASYWDTTTSGIADDADTNSPEGKTDAELQTPTSATGIYADWHDLDLTNDSTANAVDDPWTFGTGVQYPVLIWGGLKAPGQYDDYDADDDGLIDISTLPQLDAIRYDLDGDGVLSQTDKAKYAAAFPSAGAGMGCPTGRCNGYELQADLTFDTNGDGKVDSLDSYPNWMPIGASDTAAFTSTFDGNGRAISKMKINSAAARVGLFGSVSSAGTVKGVRLLDAALIATGTTVSAGALAGKSAGTISASSAAGTVSSTGTGVANIGGLVGESAGNIYASWARASVSAAGADSNVGGLAGKVESAAVIAGCARGPASGSGASAAVGGLIGETAGTGNIVSASYSTGKVTASGTSASVGGLIGSVTATTFTASYWDVDTSGIADDSDTNSPEGKTTAELQSPTSAAGVYANWDNLDLTDDSTANAVDDPWTFGTGGQYPVLIWGGLMASDQYDDHDADDDGLLEITNLRQLNAVRYDLGGEGAPSQSGSANYAAAFVNAASGMGCPSDCVGYELANDLTFDTDGDGAVDDNDSYPNWTPIGTSDTASFSATFDGNGKTISKMKINSAAVHVGLFGAVSGIVKGVGLLDVDVNATYSGPGFVGALAGRNTGTITASYATGKVSAGANTLGGLVGINVREGWIGACWADVEVSSSAPRGRTGGFVGVNYATIIASYSRGDVSALTHLSGGFAATVGRDVGASITASYSTGKVTSQGNTPGGFVSFLWNRDNRLDVFSTVNHSYWDTDASGIPDDAGTDLKGEGESTAEMQAPNGPHAMYDDWYDLDLTNDGKDNPVDDPWNFGNNKQYPVLIWGGLRAEDQRDDHDLDGDGLIEITSLRHLDAMCYDLNGDGSADSDAVYHLYAAAFPRAASGMGCPTEGCTGYELAANLTFDTDGDGEVDSDDAFPNWTPIGDAANGFAATFDGNGNTISKLKIDGGAADIGLFGGISSTGKVKGVGLLEVSITATKGARAGALAGENAGTITSSYAKGALSATSTKGTNAAGGLVGSNVGTIGASWAGVTVSSAGYQDSAGGLAGANYGKIFAAYATGGVTSTGPRSAAGGLTGGNVTSSADIKSSYSTGAASATGTSSTAAAFVGWGNGQISDSYWDATASGVADDADATSPEGKTTSELQTPTSATGIYANWDDIDIKNDGTADDDPWDFGTSSQYPVLSFGDLKAASQRP